MKRHQKSLIPFVITIFLFSACASIKFGSNSDDKKLAQNVVNEYHKLYNEQNYEEIFNAAHEEARRTKSKEALGLALAQAFEKYGKYVSSELVYSKVETVNANERQVDFAYRSKFENGTRNETFLIVTNDQKGALYAIGELSDDELEKLKSK